MIRWFQGDSQDPERALQCWQILISKASNRQTVRFSALAEMMGFNDPLSVLPALGKIGRYCHQNNWPLLDALVVSEAAGVAGPTFEGRHPDVAPNVESERAFDADWFGIVPPTPKELGEAE